MFTLPSSTTILLTDTLSSPADFLLHQGLSSHIKSSKSARCIVLSSENEKARWDAVAAKSGVNLPQKISSGCVQFIHILEHVRPPSKAGSSEAGLRPILDLLSDDVNGTDEEVLVILDDVSILEWIGFEAQDVGRFCRAVRVLCLKKHATLYIRHHITTPDDPTSDPLFRLLLKISTYHVDVRPLGSGRSGAVSGEIALHAGPSASDSPSVKLIPRSAAMQYRLTDGGAVYFERGYSRGVL